MFWHSRTWIWSAISDILSFSPCRSFLWKLWVFRGERATSDISSWAHLINKWINYARFMGWCTSKHFKGHAECPWGAVMRGSSTQRQIWWPRFMWTWSFSHFVCARSFLSPALRRSVSRGFLSLPFCFVFFLALSLSLSLSVSHLLPPSPSPLRFPLIDPLFISAELRFKIFPLSCTRLSLQLLLIFLAIIYPFHTCVVCSVGRSPN